MEEKQSILKRCMLVMALSVLCILSCFMIAKPKEAQAASSYKYIDFNGEPTKAVKTGKYYYKCKFVNGNWRLYWSKKKSSGYTKTPVTQCYGFWANNKYVYYIKNSDYSATATLCRYNLSTNKVKEIKSLNSAVKNSSCTLEISKFYGGKIYFTVEDESNWCYRTYYYNKSSNKVKKAKSNCAIIASSGKYCVCQKQYTSEAGYVTLNLYKITSSGGMKKVKTLTKKGWPEVKITNKKIYYVAYSSSSMKKFTVYRINRTGRSKKKMTTVKTSGMNYISKITSKSVKYTTFSSSGTSKTHTKKY